MLFTTCLHSKTGAQNCKQTKCVNKFDTENNFNLDYLSESSRHEANILSKWVWICSHYPPYTATWYSTPVSCSQIAMSPQNVLCTQCVFCLCCNLDLEVVPEHLLYGEQQPQKQVHPKLWYRNPEKRENIDGKQSVIFRCNTSLHSDKLV